MMIGERTAGTLVVQEGSSTTFIVVGACIVVGVVLAVIGLVKEQFLFLAVGAVFFFYGLKHLLFGRWHTHRFDRARAMVAIDSRGMLGAQRRELPLAAIADIVVEERRGRNSRSYYIHYVTRDGERIPWAQSYDGAKEETFECSQAAREFLGLPPTASPAPAGPSPSGTRG